MYRSGPCISSPLGRSWRISSPLGRIASMVGRVVQGSCLNQDDDDEDGDDNDDDDDDDRRR